MQRTKSHPNRGLVHSDTELAPTQGRTSSTRQQGRTPSNREQGRTPSSRENTSRYKEGADEQM